MKETLVWVERNATPGALVPASQVTIPLYDRGFWYGDGVFETVRVWSAAVPLLGRHIARLTTSLATLGFPALALEPAAWRQRCHGVISANRVGAGYLRIAVSRGEGPRGFQPPANPDWVLFVEAGNWVPTVNYDQVGMTAASAPWPVAAGSPLGRVKSLSALDKVLAKQEATRLGVDELIFRNTDGHLAEGASNSLFLVQSGELCTPALECGVLPGITRSVVIDLARRTGREVRETRLLPEALRQADEAFLCNSLLGIIPLVAYDGRCIGGRTKPGPTALAFRRLYAQVLDGYIAL